ncbi:hypothetical protein [Bradyrhizobium sp.]|uniref:hypothetical protein n=1 Tax=Bradyrhizobium sp. TaxID=376 RepID=UPI002D670707|nr:hypothetical protein [Bradyrhizobium sp.]HZR71886.1 hypothetical protein [Bradyrhizobium sp.]
MEHPVTPIVVGLLGTVGLFVKIMAERSSRQEDHWLRHLLKRTYPIPYAIWMAGLGVTLGYPALLFVWAVHGFSAVNQMLFLMILLPCLGCLIGFYITQCLRLPWLATFGDCLNIKPRSPEEREKDASRQSVLACITMTAAITVSVALAFGLGVL